MLTLPACGERQLPAEPEEEVLTYAALNRVSKTLEESIARFNKEHADIQIEIRDYSDEGGRERLQTELVLGQVPDIMELRYYGKEGEDKRSKAFSYKFLPGSYTGPEDGYWMPYRQMAQKGYLADLWPYIENDPDLGRDAVLEAPLKAAEVNGGLYMLFHQYEIFTLMGRESVVGARYSWTLDDVMEILAAMPEESTVMRYNMTKREVFFNLLSCSLERYVDREKGECYFDSEGFRDLVGFMQNLPDEAGPESEREAEEEIMRRIKNGTQMLEGIIIDWPMSIGYADGVFLERGSYVGYPTEDGSSGSFFDLTGTILGMSSVCRNKEAAWEYIRTLITPCLGHSSMPIFGGIPVNLHDYEVICRYEMKLMKNTARRWPDPEDAAKYFGGVQHFRYGPEIPMLTLLTEEDNQRHRDLIDHTTQIYWLEDELSNTVWDTLGPYFAGDRTLDDTIALIQNRVGLYLNENK